MTSLHCRAAAIVYLMSGMCAVMLAGGRAAADHGDRLNELLSSGQLAAAEQEFSALAEKQPDDQQVKLAVGLVHFLQAIEGLAADQYRFGLLNQYARVPIMRLPVPANPNPQQISYDQLRKLLEDFGGRLARAEQSLAQVDVKQVKLTLLPGRIRFDIDGDGEAGPEESLWTMFSTINPGVQVRWGQGNPFSLGIDGADVHWLRGYCHVLMAFCDLALAYDGREWFESCGQLLYPHVDTPL